jgi:hypothetical protein
LNFGGKFECWQEDYSGHFWFSISEAPFPVTFGDATSGDVTAPHCSSTNTTWMVFLYLEKKLGSGTNRGFRVVDNKMYAYLQERAVFSYFYPKRKVLDDGVSTEPLDI